MNRGHYTIWYNHEDHVWDIYDGRKGFKYPEFTINNYSTFMGVMREKLSRFDTDRNRGLFYRLTRFIRRLTK
jgi:hypothetical protein